MPWDHLVFAGFNALNQAEETIIYSLVKKGMASVLWDADKYYLDNRNHEAGFFLRKYRKGWSSANFTFTGDHFSIAPKEINIYGVPRNVNQAKLAGEILSSLPRMKSSHTIRRWCLPMKICCYRY
jgi:ATP-dependent helicase/nuclease subunit B